MTTDYYAILGVLPTVDPIVLTAVYRTLEPISKLPEEDQEASELDESKKVLRVELPSDEETPPPLYPGEEAFDEPTAGIST